MLMMHGCLPDRPDRVNSSIVFQSWSAMFEKRTAAAEAVEWVDESVVKGAEDRAMEVVEMEMGLVQEA